MFDILQGDMTRSKVILAFTCLKMYIARSGDTSGSRITLYFKRALFTLKKGHFSLRKKGTFWVLDIFFGGGGKCPPPPGSAALDTKFPSFVFFFFFWPSKVKICVSQSYFDTSPKEFYLGKVSFG